MKVDPYLREREEICNRVAEKTGIKQSSVRHLGWALAEHRKVRTPHRRLESTLMAMLSNPHVESKDETCSNKEQDNG
jgi:hypothetical protein